MVHRASKLFLPTLRDPPADAEAASHKLLVRGGYIRQVGAGIWTYLPLGWKVHERVTQIVREEIDAIGGQEMLMPVLTPLRALAAVRPRLHRRDLPPQGPRRPRLRAPDDARGDGHLPRARDPELPAAAADPLPLLDQGARRAAVARRPDPRARVHHEGLVLVRPGRGGARAELPGSRARRTTGSSSAAGSRRTPPRRSPG